MTKWERRERHEITIVGPVVIDAVDGIAALHEALSDYRQVAVEPPYAEVPPGAVTLSAAGGVLTVRIEHVESTGQRPGEEPEVERG